MYVRIRFCIFLWCFLRKKRCTTTGPQGGETHLFEQRNLSIPHARGKDNCDDYFAVLLLCSHYFTPLFSSTERSKDLVRPKAIRFCQLQCSGPTKLRYHLLAASSLISVSAPSLSHFPPSNSLARLISRLSTARLQSVQKISEL
jgi:hypothetical protein